MFVIPVFMSIAKQGTDASDSSDYNVLISHHGHADLEGTDGWVRDQTTATKFVKWAMHDAQSRASIHAVHLAWPKPTWPMWSPNDFNPNKVVVEEERRYREENHYPTTGFWAESPGWFYEYARNGEAALSFLGLLVPAFKAVQPFRF